MLYNRLKKNLTCKLILFEGSVVLLMESSRIEMISVILSLSLSFSVEASLLSENFFVDDVLSLKTKSSIKKDHYNVNK